MCMAFWLQTHKDPNYKFVLAFNRDEDMARPYKPVHYWESNPKILAGLDIPSTGTWLGLNVETGNVAFLTNCDYMPWKPIKGGIEFSRGYLITRFLEQKNAFLTKEQYEEILLKVKEQKENYNGFNLVYTNINGGVSYYINNYEENVEIKALPENLPYALTNGVLHNDLYKAGAYQNVLPEILKQPDNTLENTKERIFQLMRIQKCAPPDKLPTGLPDEELKVEQSCSSIFVGKHKKTKFKGDRVVATMWTGLIILTADNKLHFYEHIYDHNKKREAKEILHPIFGKYGIQQEDLSNVDFVENHIMKEY